MSYWSTFLFICLYVLGRPLGKVVYCLVRAKRPRFLVQGFLRYFFIKKLQVDVNEARPNTLKSYATVLDFFTRRLQPELRPIAADRKKSRVLISPVDGLLSHQGLIELEERGNKRPSYRVKGKEYSLKSLLGETYEDYIGGMYMLFYLSPRDYHRLHAPIDSYIQSAKLIEGLRLPVNPFSLSHFDDVFGKNKRLRLEMAVDKTRPSSSSSFSSKYMYIWVSALNVGSFEIAFDSQFYSRLKEMKGSKILYNKASAEKMASRLGLTVKKAQDMGAFQLGSSVLLFFPPGLLQAKYASADILRNPLEVRMGQEIARLV